MLHFLFEEVQHSCFLVTCILDGTQKALFSKKERYRLKQQMDLLIKLADENGGIFMETWITFVTEVGFPIAVTFYLLHRIEGKLNVLIESIRALPEKMN